MRERVLVLGLGNASLYEPRLRGDSVQRLDYYHSYLKLLHLASDGATDVYLADSSLVLGYLRNVDFESLIELDSDQAQRSIRDAYAIANKERKRKLDERFSKAQRLRRSVTSGAGDGGAGGGFDFFGGGDCAGGDGGGD